MTGKRRFVYSYLETICNEAGVTLLEDYSDKYLTRDTKITGKCIRCDNSFIKTFDKLDKNRVFACKKCTINIKFEKVKNTMLENYGVEYAAQSEVCMNKMKDKMLEKYGVEYATQSEKVKDKIKATNLERYGCDYGLQNKDIIKKREAYNLEKYGVKNCTQREDVKEKTKATNLEKYGVKYNFQRQDIKEKIKTTNLEKYGTEYGFQNEIIKEKIKATNLEKYGVEYNLQRDDVKEKIKATNIEKYGVKYVTQNPIIAEKMTKMSYYKKEYLLPSGKVIKIQGYEHYAIDELLNNNIDENNIITGCSNVPEIWYFDKNNKKRRHFVDIFIPSLNKCIEVKSTWTMKTQKDIVFLKQEAGKKLGYDYEIWVYGKDGKKVDFYS
jgi:hypothetical protein